MTPHGKQYITQDSSYPAPIEQANLRQIPELAKRFNVLTGLSDHTLGTTASVAAIAVGACWIEKQFTLSRSDAGPDSAFSLEPDELHRLCEKHETPSSLWERPASIFKKLKRVVRSFVNHYISVKICH